MPSPARTEGLTQLTDKYGDQVLAASADVANINQLQSAVDAGVERFGRIDFVANNAGYGVFGAVEEATDAQARAIFDTNVHGVLNVLRATLPMLRAQNRATSCRAPPTSGRWRTPASA